MGNAFNLHLISRTPTHYLGKVKPRGTIILGAGGLAREVAWLIRDINRVELRFDMLGYVITDTSKLSPYDSSDEILGDYSWLDQNRDKWECLVIGVGNPTARLKIAEVSLNCFHRQIGPPWSILRACSTGNPAGLDGEWSFSAAPS